MAEAKRSRLLSLDVLRGLAVAGMIVVTNPGDWNQSFSQLQHAAWAGWTVTDLIFPTFLFAVGLALGLSFPRVAEDGGSRAALWWAVARRVILLILMGWALEVVSTAFRSMGATGAGVGDLSHLRIPGVLQRIGLCYGLAAALILSVGLDRRLGMIRVPVRAVVIAIAAILIGYAVVMLAVPVPGYGAGHLDPEGNMAAWIDRALFTPAHMWPLGSMAWGGPVVYDPEGLLATIPACVNVLAGALAAWAWRKNPANATWKIAAAGAILIVAGLALDPVFPINKRIWTSSFALLSTGAACVAFGAITMLLQIDIARRLSWPLRVLGANAIVAFVLSQLFVFFRGFQLFSQGEGKTGLQDWANGHMLLVITDPKLASLAVALLALTATVMLVWPLHRRGLHLKL